MNTLSAHRLHLVVLMTLLLCLSSRRVQALQLLRATQTLSGGIWDLGIGTDFVVYASIDVTAIGIFDGDQTGLGGAVATRIFKSDQVVVECVADASDARANNSNPFVFKAVQRTRLAPGNYSVISAGFAQLWYLTTYRGEGVVDGDTSGGAVAITAAIGGGDGSLRRQRRATTAPPFDTSAPRLSLTLLLLLLLPIR